MGDPDVQSVVAMKCKFTIGQKVVTDLKGQGWRFDGANAVRGPDDGEIVTITGMEPTIDTATERRVSVIDGVWLQLAGYESWWASTTFKPLTNIDSLKSLLTTKEDA